jgi:hypothetical protein
MKGRPIEHATWWRMPPAPPPRPKRSARSALWWTAPYWVTALGVAWAIHADIIRLRDRNWGAANIAWLEAPPALPSAAGPSAAGPSAAGPSAAVSSAAAAPPAPQGTSARVGRSSAGDSCQHAIDAYRAAAGTGVAMPPSAHAALLDQGAYFAHCAIPDSMKVRICAAVQRGRAAAVTVQTTPVSEAASRCIATAVRRLPFAHAKDLEVTATVFE